MKTMTLLTGSAEWHAHRAQHFNASDAPAMLGCSPYTTRAELLRKLHTGLSAEVDHATQRRFDDGHHFEALARPLAEKIIGDDLAPVVGVLEGTKLSASFDGLTLMSEIAFEHKTLNDDLRAALQGDAPERIGGTLAKHYRVQMEQQCMVSGAERVLFMASKWEGDQMLEHRFCWYYPDPALRAEIVAGWAQFERDLETYQPAPAAAVVVAAPVQALPAVTVLVEGSIAIRDNFAAFEVALRDFLEHRLIREPKTDQDFADLDVQIKAMKGAEAALESAEAQMLAQIQTVDQAKRTKDMLGKLVRENRLMAEKLLASEKDRRRAEIVACGVKALADHVANLNKRLGKAYVPPVQADFGGCIRGMKSLTSMEDKVATELARAKIAANEVADGIDANLRHLREHAEDFKHLFPDTASIVLKAPDDLQALVSARISEHKAAEDKRLAAERERIRVEEEAKAQAKVRAEQEAAARAEEQRQRAERQEQERQQAADRAEKERVTRPQETAQLASPPTTEPRFDWVNPGSAQTVVPMPTRAPAAAATPPTLRLGQINERIAPLSIDAAGLAALGFPHAATDKAAKLFHERDFPAIVDALVARLVLAKQREAA